ALYEVTFERKWLDQARQLADYTIAHFYEEEHGQFYFTSDLDDPLIARKMELNDNVIPASNSAMALALFRLGHLLDRNDYLAVAEKQLNGVSARIASYASGYSNWGLLMMHRVFPFYEIAICGEEAEEKRRELSARFLPNALLAGSIEESDLPLLEHKWVAGETFIYVCVNKTCQLPVKETAAALKQIR